jgi:ABC-type uncharacterized transport system permease subunit
MSEFIFGDRRLSSVNKYTLICLTAARSNLAYLTEVASRGLFVFVILYIFLQLWRVTYAETNAEQLGGFTLAQMLWYLGITESIVLSSPPVAQEVDQDVRTGALAVQLILSFYLGNSEGLTQQWRNAMITFSTYPGTLFDRWVKLLLYTLIPSGFVSYLPIEALRSLSIVDTLMAIAGSAMVLLVGVGVFYHGLRRYSSGNLMNMRG